jgi:hypothetical protein
MKTVDHLSFYIKDINRKDPEGISQDDERRYIISDDAKTIKYIIPKTDLASSKTYVVTMTTEVKEASTFNGTYGL